ncbi:MAG TPA: VOC family protein [Acidimicrobiales bacterium]|nr:VOC family protein [Acidimicrobiales bacterium]
MGFNHVAFATRDLLATHRFYTDVMGFRLVKVVTAPTDTGGWARHVFYDTGGAGKGLIAFWDLHDDTIGNDFPTDLSRSHSLPAWVNHLAFDSPDRNDLEAHKQRWREHGITVAEVDHGFCRSIYATDPNGILVEFCWDVRPLDASDEAEAEALFWADQPPLSEPPGVEIFKPIAPAPSPA